MSGPALPCPFDQYPEVDANCVYFKFKGRKQKDTYVTDAKAIEVIMLLPRQQVAKGSPHPNLEPHGVER